MTYKGEKYKIEEFDALLTKLRDDRITVKFEPNGVWAVVSTISSNIGQAISYSAKNRTPFKALGGAIKNAGLE